MTAMKWNQSKQARQTRRVLSWGMLVTMAIAPMSASLAAEVTGRSVYTGVDHYGVRWFSDAAPANGAHYTTLTLPGEPSPVTPPVVADDMATAAQGHAAIAPSAASADAPAVTGSPKGRTRKPAIRRTVDRAAERDARQLARRCQRYDADLRKIADQLRAGYHARSGRKLHQRQRQLEDQRYAECSTRSG